ncbi:MAG TPA: UbiX family flavin prenyltransferase [Polyangiales bacterium]
MGRPLRIVVGISGASGAPYAERLLGLLTTSPLREQASVSLVLSATAAEVWQHECRTPLTDLSFPTFSGRDYSAPFASGSSAPDAMLIIPASMSTVARIAQGISDNLLTRAADVVLKERKRLIVVPRETPYSEIHLKNLLELTRLGALVLPASPSFYGKPQSVTDLLDTVVGRVLDHLGLEHTLTRRWGADVRAQSTPEKRG